MQIDSKIVFEAETEDELCFDAILAEFTHIDKKENQSFHSFDVHWNSFRCTMSDGTNICIYRDEKSDTQHQLIVTFEDCGDCVLDDAINAIRAMNEAIKY
jgi:hypothetical protein